MFCKFYLINSTYFLKVAIVTPDCVMRGETTIAALQAASVEVEKMVTQQHHEHHLVTGGARPVTLLATSNGTQIAVQVGFEVLSLFKENTSITYLVLLLYSVSLLLFLKKNNENSCFAF